MNNYPKVAVIFPSELSQNQEVNVKLGIYLGLKGFKCEAVVKDAIILSQEPLALKQSQFEELLDKTEKTTSLVISEITITNPVVRQGMVFYSALTFMYVPLDLLFQLPDSVVINGETE